MTRCSPGVPIHLHHFIEFLAVLLSNVRAGNDHHTLGVACTLMGNRPNQSITEVSVAPGSR